MTRHITDHPRQPTPDRIKHYLALVRETAPHATTQNLQTRKGPTTAARRMQEFLRIERGWTA